MAKETYLHGKRDLLIWQERPADATQETCTCGKKGLLGIHMRTSVTNSGEQSGADTSMLMITGLFCHVKGSLLTFTHTSASADPRPVSNLVTCKVWRANRLSFGFVRVLLTAMSTRCRSVRSALLASRARTKRDTLVADIT